MGEIRKESTASSRQVVTEGEPSTGERGRGLVRRRAVEHVVLLFSTGLYTGYSPIAPGTVGTIVAIPLFLVLSRLSAWSYGLTVVTFLCMAIWMARVAERIFQKRDSRQIVIDEVGGFLVTMAFLPVTPQWVFLGFLLFRFFDIAKPFPIRRLETLKGGYGVVADDIMAGIYSNLSLRLCIILNLWDPPFLG